MNTGDLADLKILSNFCNESLGENDLPTADAIFFFASHEETRAREAARLYHLQKAPVIIVTAGYNHHPESLPKEFHTESDYAVSILLKEGVPRESIVLENTPQNLLENVVFGMRKARSLGVDIGSLILFSWPPLIRRAEATFKKQFPSIALYSYGFKTLFHEEYSLPEIKRLLGEIKRYKIYAENGDMCSVVIPPEVIQAYARLEHASLNPADHLKLFALSVYSFLRNYWPPSKKREK